MFIKKTELNKKYFLEYEKMVFIRFLVYLQIDFQLGHILF